MKSAQSVFKGAILAALTILVPAALVLAHGNEQHVMGTVTKIDAGTTSLGMLPPVSSSHFLSMASGRV